MERWRQTAIAPAWVRMLSALCLDVGTMIGNNGASQHAGAHVRLAKPERFNVSAQREPQH
jgi:hypothetical protein